MMDSYGADVSREVPIITRDNSIRPSAPLKAI